MRITPAFPYRNDGCFSRAFTLVELITVIAIVGVLAAILIPVVGVIRSNARASECASNLRQWSVIFTLYAADNKQEIPTAYYSGNTPPNWFAAFDSYIPKQQRIALTWCKNAKDAIPGEYTTSYGMNRMLMDVSAPRTWRMDRIINPSRTILLGDAGINPAWHSSGAELWPTGTHDPYAEPDFREPGGRANLLFADGHVKALTQAEITPVMFEPYQ